MDVKSRFALLHAKLSRMGFGEWNQISDKDVLSGAPLVYCAFMRFILRHFSKATQALMLKYSWFVMEDSDNAFGASILRLLSQEYHYARSLTPQQFNRSQFATQKIDICLKLIETLSAASRAPGAVESRLSDTLEISSVGVERTGALTIATDACSLYSIESSSMIDQRRHYLNSLPRD